MNGPFGFLIIDKPEGLTSHDCVNKIRRIFRIKRVGHGGTLDPSVTGVLPIALGPATRLLPYLPSDKRYKGIIQLGKRTTSDDLHGEIISNQSWPTLEPISIERHLDEFRGQIQQRPPNISSVHIKGERAYKRVRRGEIIELPERTITIHELLLHNWDQKTGEIEINVHCSSGTYIRALARDLGDRLGCGGCLAKLRRSHALGFQEKEACLLPLSSDEGSTATLEVLPPLQALRHLPRIQLTTQEELRRWRTGRQIIASRDRFQPAPNSTPYHNQLQRIDIVVIDPLGEVVGIGDLSTSSELQPKVVFNALG